MDGVITAITGFVFVCIIMPHLVKNKPQFYLAFALLLVIVLLQGLSLMFAGSVGRALQAVTMLLVVGDLLLLVLASGGLSMHELGGEFRNAIEVMRRGEETKTVIIPPSTYAGQIRPPATSATPRREGGRPEPPSGEATPGGPSEPRSDDSIPLA